MQPTKSKLLSPLKYHGGKSYLARRIIGLMPPHRSYVEPFAGGLNVLLNKEPRIEITNDIDRDLINFWRQLRESIDFFHEYVPSLKYERSTFLDSKVLVTHDDDRVRAMWYLVRNRMSRGGFGEDFGWSERLRGKKHGNPIPGDVNAWRTMIRNLDTVSKRIARTGFASLDFMSFFESIESTLDVDIDDSSVLVYADPPYHPDTRTAKDAYQNEMTDLQHRVLIEWFWEMGCKVMVSGYRCPL